MRDVLAKNWDVEFSKNGQKGVTGGVCGIEIGGTYFWSGAGVYLLMEDGYCAAFSYFLF